MLDDVWYTVGGGNNVAGCTDAIALDLKQVPEGDLVWVHVAELPRHGPLASEGLSLQALPSRHTLLAWGGYNGQYHNHLHCFKPGMWIDALDDAPSQPIHPVLSRPVSFPHPPTHSGSP